MAIFKRKKYEKVPENYKDFFCGYMAMFYPDVIDDDMISFMERYNEFCKVYNILVTTRPEWKNTPEDVMYLCERSISSLKAADFLSKLELEYEKK